MYLALMIVAQQQWIHRETLTFFTGGHSFFFDLEATISLSLLGAHLPQDVSLVRIYSFAHSSLWGVATAATEFSLPLWGLPSRRWRSWRLTTGSDVALRWKLFSSPLLSDLALGLAMSKLLGRFAAEGPEPTLALALAAPHGDALGALEPPVGARRVETLICISFLTLVMALPVVGSGPGFTNAAVPLRGWNAAGEMPKVVAVRTNEAAAFVAAPADCTRICAALFVMYFAE